MKRFLVLSFLLAGLMCIALPVNAQVKKAEKALKKQQYEEALAFVETALEKKADDAKAYEVQGRIYQGMASAAEVDAGYVALLSQMMEAFDQAALLDEKMIQKVETNLTLGYLTQFQRGIEVFTEAQSAEDNDIYLKSARYFEGCTVIMPDSTGPYVDWAFALMGAQRDVEAMSPLEQVVAKGRADASVFSYLSSLYLSNDRAEDAVPLLEDATEQFPDNGELQDNLLSAYAVSGQYDRAIEAYEKTVQHDPDNKVYRYNLGSLLLYVEDYDAAIEQLKEAVRLDSEYTDAQYNLGASYVNKAIGTNSRMNEIDDDLRENRSSLSEEEIAARESEIESLTDERRELFALAVEPLEKARILAEAEGKDIAEICRVLFQSYVQTNQTDKAESAQECAFG